MQSRNLSCRYRIGEREVRVATRDVWLGGERIPTEPQVFDLLLFLIENRSRVVSKSELVETIWDGRAISDATLSSCVKAARRALGDDGDRQRMIRTVHRRGFHFVGPVEMQESADHPSGPTAFLPNHEDGHCHVQCAGVHREAAVGTARRGQPSLAILPFQVWGEERSGLVAEGLQRDLTVQCARTRWLFVSARASVLALAARGVDPEEIGTRLGVRYLLDGALVVADGQVRLAVTLTDTQRRCEIWAERFERRNEEIFGIQDEIVDLITRAVEVEIESQECRRALLQPPASLDAWSAYHRALFHLFRFGEKDQREAAEYLHLAERLDPIAPRVLAALSFLYWQRAFLNTGEDAGEDAARALDYAYRSVALDPLDPQCHWALGRARYLEGELDLGLAELGRAIELNPSFAHGHYSLALLSTFAGRYAEGLPAVDRARRLSPYDPMSFAFSAVRAQLLLFSGEVATGADWADRAVREPNAHHHITTIAAWCNELAGRRAQAVRYVTDLKKKRPDYRRADYFHALPLSDRNRTVVDEALERVGL